MLLNLQLDKKIEKLRTLSSHSCCPNSCVWPIPELSCIKPRACGGVCSVVFKEGIKYLYSGTLWCSVDFPSIPNFAKKVPCGVFHFSLYSTDPQVAVTRLQMLSYARKCREDKGCKQVNMDTKKGVTFFQKVNQYVFQMAGSAFNIFVCQK